MKKLFSLDNKKLTNGISQSSYNQTGLWSTAKGLNNELNDIEKANLLSCSKAPTTLYTCSGYPISSIADAKNWGLGVHQVITTTGEFINIDLSNNTAVDLRVGNPIPITTGGIHGGLFQIKQKGGNGYTYTLYQLAGGVLGAYNNTGMAYPAGWNDNLLTFQLGFSECGSPVHTINNKTYIGGKGYVGLFGEDTNGNITLNSTAFDTLGADVTAMNDDGKNLIIATSTVPGVGTNFSGSVEDRCNLIYWGRTGPDAAWITTFPGETMIAKIVKTSKGTFAIGQKAIYQIQFGYTPKVVRVLKTPDAPYSPSLFGGIGAKGTPNIASFNEGVIFGDNASAFSVKYAGNKIVYSNPLNINFDAKIKCYAGVTNSNNLVVGADDKKIYLFDLSKTGNTTEEYKTVPLRTDDRYSYKKIRIDFPFGLKAGDDVRIKLYDHIKGTAVSEEIKVDYNMYKDKTYVSKTMLIQLPTNGCILGTKLIGGEPIISKIDLYGEKDTA